MPDSPVPPSRWGDSPPWWLNSDASDDEPPPSAPFREDAPRASGPVPVRPTPAPMPVGPVPGPRPPQPEAVAFASGPQGSRRPRRPRRKILLLGAPGGLCALIAVVAGGTLLLGGKDGGDAKRITLRSQAGGLTRDAADPAASTAYPFITEAVRRGFLTRTGQTSAVYSGAGSNVLFVGGTVSIGDPGAFLNRARPNTVLTFQHVGRSVCGTFAVLSEVHPYCAWATSGSYGFVASNVPGQETAGLAKLTSRLRSDLER